MFISYLSKIFITNDKAIFADEAKFNNACKEIEDVFKKLDLKYKNGLKKRGDAINIKFWDVVVPDIKSEQLIIELRKLPYSSKITGRVIKALDDISQLIDDDFYKGG